MSFTGELWDVKRSALSLEPHSRGVAVTFKKGDFDNTQGVYFIRAANDESVPLALLREVTYREMEVPRAELTVEALKQEDNVLLIVKSSSFAHAVHFKLQDEINLSDEYFDMLPGEVKGIIIYNAPDNMDIKAIKAYAV